MESAEFLVHCKELLDEEKHLELFNLLQDEDRYEIVKDCGWELVSVLCKRLGDENEETCKTCKQCLVQLLEICSAKEVLLGVCEQMSTQCNIKCFVNLISICKVAILKLKRRPSKYCEDICEQAINLVKQLIQTEGFQINDLIEKLCDTLNEFVFNLSTSFGRKKFTELKEWRFEESFTDVDWEEQEILMCRKILLKFILNFLATIINDIIPKQDYIQRFMQNFFRLTCFTDLMYNQDDECFNSTGFVMFLHWLIVQNRESDEFPLVFRTLSLFNLAAKHISFSIKRSANGCVQINLELLKFLLERLKNNEVTIEVNLSDVHKGIAVGLTNVMIWSQEQAHRETARDIFSLYLTKVGDERYLLLRYVYEQSEHPGLLGYLINLINESLQQFYQKNITSHIKDISSLALEFIKLSPGESNILHESDRLMAGLNFTRFWLLKDRKLNKVGIWDIKLKLEQHLNLILKCIDASRNEFKNAFDGLEQQSSNANTNDLIELMLPGGEALKELPKDQKLNVLRSAHLNVDMMASVASRINEIIKDNG